MVSAVTISVRGATEFSLTGWLAWSRVSGIVYGMGPGLLAQKLGLTLRESSTLMRSFSARYPLVKRWEHQVRPGDITATAALYRFTCCLLTGRLSRANMPVPLFAVHKCHLDSKPRPSMLGVTHTVQEKAAPPRFALEDWG